MIAPPLSLSVKSRLLVEDCLSSLTLKRALPASLPLPFSQVQRSGGERAYTCPRWRYIRIVRTQDRSVLELDEFSSSKRRQQISAYLYLTTGTSWPLNQADSMASGTEKRSAVVSIWRIPAGNATAYLKNSHSGWQIWNQTFDKFYWLRHVIDLWRRPIVLSQSRRARATSPTSASCDR